MFSARDIEYYNVDLVSQDPNNRIGYTVVGEGDAAEYFYVHPTDGAISLLASVRYSGRSLYRVRCKTWTLLPQHSVAVTQCK